jgi:enoyl-CoA hydratase
MENPVHCTTDGNEAIVTIDRPDSLNALSTTVHDQLYEIFSSLDDGNTTTIRLRSAGTKAFVAGADLDEIDGMSVREFERFQRNSRQTIDSIEAHPAVIIAEVTGIAYGGGCELALASDIVVADSNSKFAVPEVTLGLIPGGGATQRLPRIVGPNKAIEMLTTGEPISGTEAHTFGFVNHVVEDPDEVTRKAEAIAESIDSNAPRAVRAGKRLVREGMESSLPTGLSYEHETTFNLYQTDDAEEGIRAFVEDREPSFEGQ